MSVFSAGHLMGKLRSLGLSSWVHAGMFLKSRRTYLYIFLLYKEIWACPRNRRVSPVGYYNIVRIKENMSWHEHGSKFSNCNIFVTSTEDSINVAFVKMWKRGPKMYHKKTYQTLQATSYNSSPNQAIPLQLSGTLKNSLLQHREDQEVSDELPCGTPNR